MKQVLKALSLSAALAFGASANAGFVNIGGLNTPVGAQLEVTSIFENVLFTAGQELKGFGEITSMNGFAISSLCTNCELTYTFDSYFVTSIGGTSVKMTGGLLKLYLGFGVDNDFNPYAPSAGSAADLIAATNGVPFLTIAGHAIDAAGNTFAGTGVGIGTAFPTGFGSGLGDIVAGGGIATSNFETNGFAAAFGAPFADVTIGSAFGAGVIPHPSECVPVDVDPGPGVVLLPIGPACVAGANFINANVIPEPGSLALLSVALLGLAATARRRRG